MCQNFNIYATYIADNYNLSKIQITYQNNIRSTKVRTDYHKSYTTLHKFNLTIFFAL